MPTVRSALILAALCLLGLSPMPSAVGQTRFDFDTTPDRVWIGRDFWANRLQDWRVVGGRVECIEMRKNLPFRTAHVLTHSLGETAGNAEISVRLGRIDPDAEPGAHAAAGLLLGAGGSHVDPRLTAQVHHVPAEDGGVLVLVERDGSVTIRRNDKPLDKTPLWSIRTPVGPDDLPIVGASVAMPDTTPEAGTGAETAGEPETGYVLTVRVRRGNAMSRIAASVSDGAGNVLHYALAEVEHHFADGSIALTATGGPEGSPAGYWFDDLTLSGDLIEDHPERTFGPIWHAMYTRGTHGIALTAQLPPLAPSPTTQSPSSTRGDTPNPQSPSRKRGGTNIPTELPEVELWADDDGWRKITTAPIIPDSWTAHFVLPDWDTSRDIPYEIRLAEPTTGTASIEGVYPGVFRAAPDLAAREYVIASLNCNKTYTGNLRWNRMGLWFPHDDLVARLAAHDPDMLYFSGDQIYEGDLTPVDARNEDVLILDYLYKWTKWCWAFGEMTRDRPTVAIPDDHDVYHGNIWGAGGRRAHAHDGLSAQDAGGYKHSPRFVNAVHRTQIGNLPPTAITPTIGAGYTTYTTSFVDAGVSFAVFADRMFKESPSVAVPEGKYRNGWPQAEGFDARTHRDDPAIPLLGKEQEQFLRDWALDWSGGVWMKVALSQSPFAGAHTLPASAKSDGVVPGLTNLVPGQYPPDDQPAADGDTNGWPRPGRDRAVEALRSGFAIHLAGDQHLSTLMRYGVDDWRDAGTCFTSPAIANTWPRRWFPSEEPARREPGAPRYTGDFLDGFGNKITMLAAANPVKSGHKPAALYDKAPGYGIVRLSRADRTITYESWPRWVDPAAPDAACYPGWPVTMKQADNCGSSWEWLAFDSISMENLEQHTLTVRRTGETEPLYTIRLYNGFVPRLPDAGPWSFETRNTVTGEVTMILPDIPASRGIDSFWNNLRKNRK